MTKTEKVLVVVLAVLVIGVAGVFAFQKLSQSKTNEPVACTLEAKQCPDGSYVSRTGANCEFVECPEISCIKEGEKGSTGCGSPDCEEICCSGLTKISDARFIPAVGGNGCELGMGSAGPIFICAYCGNGVCGKGENKCNCPGDCK